MDLPHLGKKSINRERRLRMETSRSTWQRRRLSWQSRVNLLCGLLPAQFCGSVDEYALGGQQGSLTLVHDGELGKDLLLPGNVEDRQCARCNVRRSLLRCLRLHRPVREPRMRGKVRTAMSWMRAGRNGGRRCRWR